MTAGTFNITIEQGATFQQDLIWTTNSPATPINVTGYTARMQIRDKHWEESVLSPYYTLTTGNGRITFGSTDGKITLYIPAYDTATFLFDTAIYDLDIISPSATPFITRLIQGTVTVVESVTQP